MCSASSRAIWVDIGLGTIHFDESNEVTCHVCIQQKLMCRMLQHGILGISKIRRINSPGQQGLVLDVHQSKLFLLRPFGQAVLWDWSQSWHYLQKAVPEGKVWIFYINREQPNETPIVCVCSFGRRILWQFVRPQDATTKYIFVRPSNCACINLSPIFTRKRSGLHQTSW